MSVWLLKHSIYISYMIFKKYISWNNQSLHVIVELKTLSERMCMQNYSFGDNGYYFYENHAAKERI